MLREAQHERIEAGETVSALGPGLPANWYLLGPAPRPGRIATHRIGERELVVWRGRDGGAPVAMQAHCAHMGCHLGRATVQGGKLRCPLHFRLIGADGAFSASARLHQPTLPLREYLGGLFVWLGNPAAATDLGDLGLAGNAACHAGEHRFDLPWQWLVANGLDIEHLSAVHDRRLLEPPTLERTAYALAIGYRTTPTARGLSDRIMRRLAPDGIRGRIRALSGTMMLVESQVGRRKTFILLSFLPQPGGGTLIRGIVGVKGAPTLPRRLAAQAARLLFRAFLNKDLGVLDGIAWHEPAHADSLGDRFTRETCDWFRGLPGA